MDHNDSKTQNYQSVKNNEEEKNDSADGPTLNQLNANKSIANISPEEEKFIPIYEIKEDLPIEISPQESVRSVTFSFEEIRQFSKGELISEVKIYKKNFRTLLYMLIR